MPMISYIQPLFHVPKKIDHIAADEKHKDHLQTACEDMLNNDGLLVTFIPSSIKGGYGLAPLKGKITTLLKPLPMPEGHDMKDYNQIDSLDGNNRWPYGWPFEVLCNLPEDKCPALKQIIEDTNGIGKFVEWARQFDLKKPAKLYRSESKAIQKHFEEFL